MVFVYLVVKMNHKEQKAHEEIGFLIFPYNLVIRDFPENFFSINTQPCHFFCVTFVPTLIACRQSFSNGTSFCPSVANETSSNNFKTKAMFKLQSTLGAPTGKDAGVLGLWVFQ